MENAKILANLINSHHEYARLSPEFIKDEMNLWGLTLIEKDVDKSELCILDGMPDLHCEIENKIGENVPHEDFGLSKEELIDMDNMKAMDLMMETGYAQASDIQLFPILEDLCDIGLVFAKV